MTQQWTRDDLPGAHWPGIHGESERQGAEKALDAVVDHLNANHPKTGRDFSGVERERDVAEQRYQDTAHALAEWHGRWVEMERERDEAVTRAKSAERERDEVQERADQLRDERDDAVQSWIILGRARDKWKARAEAAARELADEYSERNQKAAAWDRVAAHPALRMDLMPEADRTYAGGALERITQLAEAAEARTAPDVTRNEVWRIVAAHDPGDDEMALSRVNRLTDAVCDLFGVEAEPADPIEDKARELHEVAQGDGPFIVWEALMDVVRNRYRRMAAHVLGQEAGDE